MFLFLYFEVGIDLLVVETMSIRQGWGLDWGKRRRGSMFTGKRQSLPVWRYEMDSVEDVVSYPKIRGYCGRRARRTGRRVYYDDEESESEDEFEVKEYKKRKDERREGYETKLVGLERWIGFE